MKILHINTTDSLGGAARAAYRLHRSLLSAGADSLMLVQLKTSDDNTVMGPESNFQAGLARLRQILDRLPVRVFKRPTKTFFSPAWLPASGIIDRINSLKPDLVHLHWICGGMIKIEDFGKIKAPLVWTLHDMWAFTGGCHYDDGCGGYKRQCGSCRVLGSTAPNNLSSRIFARKMNVFPGIKKLTIVGLSHWIAREADKSNLFAPSQVVNLPNPVDMDVFFPLERSLARKQLSLPGDKRLLLFGVLKDTHDLRKGFKELQLALSMLERDDLELVVLGGEQPKTLSAFKYKTHYLGQLQDDASLRLAYSAADVVAVPSIQENLSNVIMESLSCGIPVVGFRTGGNPDMIDHELNGYLADPFDPADLARGIEWILGHPDPEKLHENARRKVLQNFDARHVAAQYLELYEEVIG